MATVLVTGGAGFIGSHVCQRLLGRGDSVVCLDNFNDYYDPAFKRENVAALSAGGGFTLVEGDIRDPEAVEQAFSAVGRGGDGGAVVHLAARAGVRPSLEDPPLYQDVNVRGTVNMLEGARRHGALSFVFGSSSSVYGSRREVPFRETDDVTRPISPYAATKLAGEALCYTYHHLYDIPITCLRFFTVYGPRGRPDMAIYSFTKAVFEGREIEMYGDGTTARDYTYVDDIVDGILAALDRRLDYEIINLGESQTTQLKDLIDLIAGAVGKPAKVRRGPERPGDVPITYADVSLARRLLDYDPKVKVPEGVPRFVEWYRKMRAGR